MQAAPTRRAGPVRSLSSPALSVSLPGLGAVAAGGGFWARITPDLDGVAKVLSGFPGSSHGFERLTGCWFRMWRFREDCLRLTDDVSFALRWPGLVRARTLPAFVPAVAVPLPVAVV